MASDPDFDPVATTKHLLRVSRSGALATLLVEGHNPFCSLVNIASLPDGSPLLLISRLAVHTRNILACSSVSLLLSARGADDPLTLPRITIVGRAESVEEAGLAVARRRYLAAHPAAEVFVNFADFSFYRVAITSVHLVAGFGRIIALESLRVLTPVSDATGLIAAEEGAVAHMNQDHADAIRLYATKLMGADDGDWQMTSIDPEGADLALGAQALRLNFPERVSDATSLRKMLVTLVAKARET
jgi:putative heme iron utilization protein